MGSGDAPLILASGSPRRRALLEALGYRLKVVVPNVAEDLDLAPQELARALALRKGRSVEGRFVVAADTVVDLDGTALGKPRDPEENLDFLRRLSGREHQVHTGLYLRGEGEVLEVHTARVRFRRLSEEEMRWYVQSGEGLDKAGGYGAQGLGMALLEGIEGDFYTVVGLPVSRVFALLWAWGFRP
ncbi:Maf family protein [Thermus filiformis]|uniref:dTTP/UTP pyrophosphatase n=1 Tax=Thermus filiformis TaxID=276 RepID=A0A0A2WTN3_THEFI|nr:Maf family protein [Thermus filiformis]KGQ21650.1 septum formation protein Maf [Thermus filiformis]